MSRSTVDPAAIRNLTWLCSWNVRNIHQWHWVFSSWSNSYPVVEGREKMGVRIDREEESLVCCFLSFFTEKVITPVSIILNGKWLSLIFPFIITKNRTLPWAGTPPLPILPFATLMCISWVYMSCFLLYVGCSCEIYSPKALWELVHSPLKWAQVRSRRGS